MIHLVEVREAIAWVERAEYAAALESVARVEAEADAVEDRVVLGEQSPSDSPRVPLGKIAARRLPELKKEGARAVTVVEEMWAKDLSLPRPDDGFQLGRLRERMGAVKQTASTLLDLAERSTGWVREQRMLRVEEALAEIAWLTAKLHKLSPAAEISV